MEKELIVIEDGRECIILNEYCFDEKKYLLLVNMKDSNDFIIRKKVNNEIIGLDDQLEFESIIKKITEDNKKINNT